MDIKHFLKRVFNARKKRKYIKFKNIKTIQNDKISYYISLGITQVSLFKISFTEENYSPLLHCGDFEIIKNVSSTKSINTRIVQPLPSLWWIFLILVTSWGYVFSFDRA